MLDDIAVIVHEMGQHVADRTRFPEALCIFHSQKVSAENRGMLADVADADEGEVDIAGAFIKVFQVIEFPQLRSELLAWQENRRGDLIEFCLVEFGKTPGHGRRIVRRSVGKPAKQRNHGHVVDFAPGERVHAGLKRGAPSNADGQAFLQSFGKIPPGGVADHGTDAGLCLLGCGHHHAFEQPHMLFE